MEKERHMKKIFGSDVEISPDTKQENYEENNCGSCERAFKSTKRCSKCEKDDLPICEENLIVKDHCHLTSKFRGLALSICILNIRKPHSSFVPILFHISPRYDCHSIFENIVNKAI